MKIIKSEPETRDQSRRLGRRNIQKGPDGVALKPGRHVVGDRTHYDGSGGSGHTGTVSGSMAPLRGSTAEQRKKDYAALKRRQQRRAEKARSRVS